jgi:FkbM family methyltransferase
VVSRVSYAQNGEDVRLWHAFGPRSTSSTNLVFVDVGANEPRHMSVTAALSDLGWRGLLIEADPLLAERLRNERPQDHVVEAAASDRSGEITFYRVPGTGLGTLDAVEANAARDRGFDVFEVRVPTRTLDDILDDYTAMLGPDIHAMTIDVEGAEAQVVAGLTRYRPWVLCIEAVEPGTPTASHQQWEGAVLDHGYRYVAFDGINRWYVADEHADEDVGIDAGAPTGTTIAEAIATPFHVIDAGAHGWTTVDTAHLRERDNRSYNRVAWQRELTCNDLASRVPTEEYERQIHELRAALISVEGSRTFALSRNLAKVAKAVRAPIQRFITRVARTPWVTRQRHLRHVTVNMGHLTDPAFLGSSADQPPSDVPGTIPGVFTEADQRSVRAWLETHSEDSDEQLFARLDNNNDELGRLRAALRTRLRLSDGEPAGTRPGSQVAFDARALQSAAFSRRGIGRFAAAALVASRQAVGDDRVTLIADPGLAPIPEELAGACRQVPRITRAQVREFGVVIQPSPMTHAPDPLIPLLQSDAYSVAIVFDFIPLHYPGVYLRSAAASAEYAACLDALLAYDDFLCISHTVREELIRICERRGRPAPSTAVAWPRGTIANTRAAHSSRGIEGKRKHATGPIVVVTGDDARKNTFGGLAGVAAATSNLPLRDVVVLGMSGHNDRVHHWSIAAAMRPGEARTAQRLTEDEMVTLLGSAACVVVPTFDEGLSLPVIEAAAQGVPVVVSDIPAHRELVGRGAFSADPRSPRSLARAVRRARRDRSIAQRQWQRLQHHRHVDLEDAITTRLRAHSTSPITTGDTAAMPSPTDSPRLRVALATPWPPQRSGVADYTAATGRALARLSDVTVFTTADARLDFAGEDRDIRGQRSIEEFLADPEGVAADFDVVVAVVGNSHFHLPFIDLARNVGCVVIAHDTRMSEFYLALRGPGGLANLMLHSADPSAPKSITPPIDHQVDDMRLLQNAALWEIARRAHTLVLHSPTSAQRIADQTDVSPVVLTFANYRAPANGDLDPAARAAARARLGLVAEGDDVIQLGTFGFVDTRTKQIDSVLEAAGWLTQWGHAVRLTVVGSAPPELEKELRERAGELALEGFEVTGYQDEEHYRDWLLAVDLGVQLRVSPYLGVSGPLSDLAAVGTPAVGSAGLCADVDTPGFIEPLPDVVSPVMLAEAIERALASPMPWPERDRLRREYLDTHSAERYAEELLRVLHQAAR